MIKSDSINKIAAALVKAQAELGSAHKGANNPFFKSSYADLATIIEVLKAPLNKHGISFIQAVDGNNLETILLHESGEYIGSVTPIIVSKPNDPQAMGSAMSYSKRYGLQAILGIPSVDDDGEAAMGRDRNANKTDQRQIYKKAAPIYNGNGVSHAPAIEAQYADF